MAVFESFHSMNNSEYFLFNPEANDKATFALNPDSSPESWTTPHGSYSRLGCLFDFLRQEPGFLVSVFHLEQLHLDVERKLQPELDVR